MFRAFCSKTINFIICGSRRLHFLHNSKGHQKFLVGSKNLQMSWHTRWQLAMHLPSWSPVENRRIYKSRFVRVSVSVSVCQCVSVSVTDYLKNRSEDFSEIWYEVGGKKYKKHSTAVFLKKFPVFSKTALFCQKNAKNMVFDTLCKKDSDNFSKNLIKCVNKWPLCFGQKL